MATRTRARSRENFPPHFWSLGVRGELEKAIRFFNDGGIRKTTEVEGHVQGTTTQGWAFEVDPEGPTRWFTCGCGASSEHDNQLCTHVIAGLVDWWQGRDKPSKSRLRSRARRADSMAQRPIPGRQQAPLFPMADVEVDPGAAALTSFVLFGRGLSQARLSASAEDPMALTLELLDPAGHSIGRLDPDRSLALPILQALPRLLGDSVRWVGPSNPARVSEQKARPVLRVSEQSGGRVVVERAIRLPGKGRRKTRVLPLSSFKSALGDGAVHRDGILYPLESVALPPTQVLGAGLEPGEKRTLRGDQVGRFLLEQAPLLKSRDLIDGDSELLDARIGEPIRLEQVKIELASEDFLLHPRFTSGEIELALEDVLQAAADGGWMRHDKVWMQVPSQLIEDLGFEAKKVKGGLRLELDPWSYLRARAFIPESTRVDRDGAAVDFEKAVTRFVAPRSHPVPSSYKGTLRAYQHQGYNWLLFLRANRLPGILADEMGLGKTHQLMAYLGAVCKSGRPSLVVCPRTVLDHWIDKVAEFAPELDPLVWFGPARGDFKAEGRAVVLTTYGLLCRDQKILAAVDWECVILDEAQRIKNAATRTAKAAHSLKARHRIAATGTPLENHLEELRSIFDFLAPGFLGTENEFKTRFVRPVENGESGPLERLRELIDPFKLRRLKQDVLTELPPKVEEIRHCHLSKHQEALYRSTLDRKARPLIEQLKRGESSVDYVHVFSVLSHLKQICDHPYLLLGTKKAKKLGSGKFEIFCEILQEAIESEQKVVVFSQYLQMLDLIGEHLESLGIGYVDLRGSTRKRAEVIRRFQNDPDCRVFLGSLLAGGVGIDLTAASTVIHYDRWWNPAREDQATDRVHRIGQEASVQVFNLVTRGTLEEAIDRMIRSKRRLFDSVIQPDESTMKTFSRDELIELLGG